MSRTTHTTFCRICEALCGLEVEVTDGRITTIRPDRQHVTTRGHCCAKGLQQHLLYDSPDRLTHPLKRTAAGRFEPVSWETALAEIGAKARRLRSEHGPDALALYLGTAGGFSLLHTMFGSGFLKGLGSRSTYSPATQDCANKFAVARLIYGFPFTQPFPDLDHTRCLIVVGANPAVSKWSFLQVPHPMERLGAIARRGQLFFIDPRRTETTAAGGEHLFIRPGTDVFFYLSFLHEVLRRGSLDRERVARQMNGLAALESLAQPWSAERTAPVTRISSEDLRRIVAAYLEADGATLYCSTGVNMGPHGALAFWLQEAINAISGNLDRRGGSLVSKGVVDFPKLAHKRGLLMRDDRSRVGGLPSVNDCFPGGVLADEILTPGPGQVRALFCTGGNPLITMANSGKLAHAMEELELLVVVDLFLNETASVAHYVLPAVSPFQRPDIPFIFPLLLGLQTEPYLQATRAVIPPEGEQRDEMWIYLKLARACGANIFGSALAQELLERGRDLQRLPLAGRFALTQERLLSAILRAAGQGGFGALLRQPHGRRLPDHRPGSFLGQRVLTASGKVELAPAPLLRAAAELEQAFARQGDDDRGLRLITRRAVMTHNSWTHNAAPYISGDRQTNYLELHPDDAAALGVEAGDLVDVSTSVATVRVPTKLTRDLQPGTVSLGHGWGHQRALGLSVAGRTTGVNVNLLAADGPQRVDPLSGMAHLTALPVQVVRAAGPLEPDDWSGRGT